MADSRSKALDLVVESLKVYVTLSTAAAAGIIALYGDAGEEARTIWLIMSLLSFSTAAVFSVVTINYFINKVHHDDYNIHSNSARILNLLAIIAFAFGLVSGVFHFFFSDTRAARQAEGPGIILTDSEIRIESEVDARIKISRDQSGQIMSVDVRQHPPQNR